MEEGRVNALRETFTSVLLAKRFGLDPLARPLPFFVHAAGHSSALLSLSSLFSLFRFSLAVQNRSLAAKMAGGLT